MESRSVYRAKEEDVLASAVGEDLVLLHIVTGSYFALNAVGSEAWSRLDGKTSIHDICAHLEAEFEVDPPTCSAEVLALMEELHQKGLVELVS